MVYGFIQSGVAKQQQKEAMSQRALAEKQAIEVAELKVKLENCR